jgi:hypothetical protein
LVEANRVAVTCAPADLRARRDELISRINSQLAPA